MKTPSVLSMKSRLVDLLRSWVLRNLCFVARCGFLLALVTGLTDQSIGAAEPTNSVLHFDGNDSYLELPPYSLDGYKAITVEAWVRPERLGFFTRFFEFGTQGGRLVACWNFGRVFNIHTEHLETSYAFPNGVISCINDNEWIHLAVVSSGKSFEGYLNGERIIDRQTSAEFYPAGDGKRYYFGRDTFGGEEEDYIGQMDEIRIWSKALTSDEIKSGLAQRYSWGSPDLVTLINSNTNRVKSIDGKESSALFRGSLGWQNQERTPEGVLRTLKHQHLELILPSNIRSLTNFWSTIIVKNQEKVNSIDRSGYNIQNSVNEQGDLVLSLDVFGFQKQPSSELYILLVAPEFGGLSAVYPLDFSPSDSRGSSVTFKPIDFNSLQLQLGNTLSKAIRDRMAVSDCLNFLGFLGLEELATEALIDAAAAGGYQSYPARELLRRKIPERLAKFFQFRQSISARFLGGTVAALGLVMGCLWIFNRQMRFAVWFGLVCVPVSFWLLNGENTYAVSMRFAVLSALLPLLFGFVCSALNQKIPVRYWVSIVALMPGFIMCCFDAFKNTGSVNSGSTIHWLWLNISVLVLLWILLELILKFRGVNESVSILHRRLVLFTCLSISFLCLGIPSFWFTSFLHQSGARLSGDLFSYLLQFQNLLVSWLPVRVGENPDLAWEVIQIPVVLSFSFSGFCLLGNRFRELRISLEASNSTALQQLEEIKIKSEALQVAQVAAETASNAKSQFLANMSHELRTPLNAIIGYSEMLQEEADDLGTPEIKPDLQKINGAGKHLLGLINDILDLSKIEAGKMTLYLETFDVRAVLDEVAAMVQPLIAKNANQLTLEISPEIGSMRADVTKVRQTLFNLLSNASKFTDKGTIILRARREGGNMVFDVIDSGIGMTPEQVSRLFQAFAQADASTSRKYGGTGLGLALSRKFCQLMGGDMSVASEHGKGSTFTATIEAEVQEVAADAAPAEKSASDKAAANTSSGPLVLVIDDDATVQDLLRRSLSRDGFRVETANNGASGLTRARELQPVIITLDVMMPGMDGWEVLGALKADPMTANIPVIVMSIVDEKGLGFSLGAADYLTKPLDYSRLSSVVNRHAQGGRGQRVLVVEDDPATQELVTKYMTKEGWQVVTANNGRAALDRVSEGKPDLVLLDLMMPEMDGFEFLEAFRQQPGCAQINVVVMTAKILTDQDRLRLQGQVAQVVAKTQLTSEMLTSKIRAAIGSTVSAGVKH